MQIKIHKNDNNKTIWENFELNIKNPNNIDEIIGALSVVNATMIGLSKDEYLIESKMLEIVEFGDSFIKKYGNKTKRARYQNWGQEAFALRLYKDLKENAQFEIEILKNLEESNEEQVKKAKKLGDTIYKIKGDKRLTICYQEGAMTLDISKYIESTDAELVQTAIFNDALKNRCGVIISRPNFDGTENIYGFRTDNYQVETIGIDELRWSYSVDSRTGKKIPVSQNLRFKEFKINI